MKQVAKRKRSLAASGPARPVRTHGDADRRSLLLSILDPSFVLSALHVKPDDLPGFGYRDAADFYLAEGVRRGVPPCTAFDPVFVLAATADPPTAAALADPAAVLEAALAAYLDAASADRPPSPSAIFDEAFVRATVPQIAEAVEAGVAPCALAAWLALGRPAVGTTASGIELFAEASPHPWWERERRAAAVRGRRRATPPRLVEEALQRVRTAEPPAMVVRVSPGIPEEVRAGETMTLLAQGFACCPGGRIGAAQLLVDHAVVARQTFQAFPRAEAFARSTELVDAHGQLFGGFAVAWTGRAPGVGEHRVALRFEVHPAEGGAVGERTLRLGTFRVRRRHAPRRLGRSTPTVAIAMTTFEPREDLLAAQIASIREQTLSAWRLTISDESVTDAGRRIVSRLARGDPRIVLRHGPRLGVVGNVERALRAVDPDAPFVALADQDDRWHADKLARLVARMEGDVALVHGAMRLVTADGAPLPLPAGTATRRDAEPTLAALLAENQVTGASALIRADVVRAALPMPRVEGLFHDHWLALVARAHGRVVFDASQVQDYVQHGDNVVGEDPERDRAAAARLAGEHRGFAALAGAGTGRVAGAGEIAAAEAALLPAAFGVVPAAVARTLALAAMPMRGLADADLAKASGGRDGEGLSPEALRAMAGWVETDAEPDRASAEPARASGIGVAPWLRAGLDAVARVAAEPALAAAVAERHHRRAVEAASSDVKPPRR